MDVAFAETADYSAEEEGFEIDCHGPESDAGDVAAHAPEQCCSASIFIGGSADDGAGYGLKEGEEGAQGPSQKDDVVFLVDWYREGFLICIKVVEDLVQGRGGTGLETPVEGEERWEEWQDERKRDL